MPKNTSGNSRERACYWRIWFKSSYCVLKIWSSHHSPMLKRHSSETFWMMPAETPQWAVLPFTKQKIYWVFTVFIKAAILRCSLLPPSFSFIPGNPQNKWFGLNFYIIHSLYFLNIAVHNMRVKLKDRFLVMFFLACFKLLTQVMHYYTPGKIMTSIWLSIIWMNHSLPSSCYICCYKTQWVLTITAEKLESENVFSLMISSFCGAHSTKKGIFSTILATEGA